MRGSNKLDLLEVHLSIKHGIKFLFSLNKVINDDKKDTFSFISFLLSFRKLIIVGIFSDEFNIGSNFCGESLL